jgi:hypothetical protein
MQIENGTIMNKNEANEVIKMFGDRGIISVIDEGDCKAKIDELGLTAPVGKDNGLLYRKVGEAVYLFMCVHDEDDPKRRLRYIGSRFDFAKYRTNPVEGVGPQEAWVLFAQAVSDLAGFDLEKSTLDAKGNFEN